MAFEAFAIVELMGHARIAGKVTEETVFGTAMMRVDVPKTGRRDGFTKFYSPNSIYCLTPTDEATAQAAAEKFDEAPVQPWILPMPVNPVLASKVIVHGEPDEYFHVSPDQDDLDDRSYLDDDDDGEKLPPGNPDKAPAAPSPAPEPTQDVF